MIYSLPENLIKPVWKKDGAQLPFKDIEAVYQPCETNVAKSKESLARVNRIRKFLHYFCFSLGLSIIIFMLVSGLFLVHEIYTTFCLSQPICFLSSSESFRVNQVVSRRSGVIEETGEKYITLDFPVELFVLRNAPTRFTLKTASVEVFQNGEIRGARAAHLGRVINQQRTVTHVMAGAVLDRQFVPKCDRREPHYILFDAYVTVETANYKNITEFHTFRQSYTVCCSKKSVCPQY